MDPQIRDSRDKKIRKETIEAGRDSRCRPNRESDAIKL